MQYCNRCLNPKVRGEPCEYCRRHPWFERTWQFVHNVVAHPLLEVLPEAWATKFHDWTAKQAWPVD